MWKAVGLSFGLGVMLGLSVWAQDGPRTVAANLPVRTDVNTYLLVSNGQYTGPDGPSINIANQLLRTDASGYLLIAFPGGLSVDYFFRLRTTNTAAPASSDCDAAGEMGRFYWDSTNDAFRICSGASGWVVVSPGGGAAPVGAEYVVSASDGTLTAEDVLTAGTAIDVTNGAGTSTIDVDLTELNTATFGAGAFTTLTFDAGASDPVFSAASGVLDLSTGTLQQGGVNVATHAHVMSRVSMGF